MINVILVVLVIALYFLLWFATIPMTIVWFLWKLDGGDFAPKK